MDWPTWNEAAVAALLSGLLALALQRSRPTRFGAVAAPATWEFAFVASLYAIWRVARKLPPAQNDGAVERARQVVRLQHDLHLPTELSLQGFVLRHGDDPGLIVRRVAKRGRTRDRGPRQPCRR